MSKLDSSKIDGSKLDFSKDERHYKEIMNQSIGSNGPAKVSSTVETKINRSASYGKPIKRNMLPSVDSELDSSAVIEGNMILGALNNPAAFNDADKDMSSCSFLKSQNTQNAQTMKNQSESHVAPSQK